ncbi:MAG: DNA polymerase IV [Acidimicrobiales bacterium]
MPICHESHGAARAILHVDMDAFFASVELLDSPELAGRAVIVGGTGPRGVVASCTYEARRHGVRSAMPTSEARAICPTGTFVAPRHRRYAEVSRDLHEIFGAFTPLVEGVGLDEAFLDVSGSRARMGGAAKIGAELRETVFEAKSLRCSVGIGTSKSIAKLASVRAKPRIVGGNVSDGPGVFEVAPGGEREFLDPLPIEAIWGVGPATARRLRAVGIKTVGEMARVGEAVLIRHLGRTQARHLADLASGIDPSPVVPDRRPRSIGHERTFDVDVVDWDVLSERVRRLAESVSDSVAREGLVGRTVALKVRFGDFRTITRAHTVESGVEDPRRLAEICDVLLGQVDLVAGVRLLGVSVSGLVTRATPRQMALPLDKPRGDEPKTAATRDLLDVVANVRTRYGAESLRAGSSLPAHQPNPTGG